MNGTSVGVKGISSRLSIEIRPVLASESSEIKRNIPHKDIIYMQLLPNRCLTSGWVMDIIKLTIMSENIPPDADSRKAALRAAGALNPKPGSVRDEAFLEGQFFDPNDLIQVKYEMLRRHREEHKSVTEVARSFGTSRQAFYTAKTLFDGQGIPGLIPKQRGPHGAHKCTEEVLDFAEQWQAAHPDLPAPGLSEAIRQAFGITINPRSVDRALARRKKKRHSDTEPSR